MCQLLSWTHLSIHWSISTFTYPDLHPIAHSHSKSSQLAHWVNSSIHKSVRSPVIEFAAQLMHSTTAASTCTITSSFHPSIHPSIHPCSQHLTWLCAQSSGWLMPPTVQQSTYYIMCFFPSFTGPLVMWSISNNILSPHSAIQPSIINDINNMKMNAEKRW